MVNNKTFELRPISELMAIVKNDLRKLDEEGLIDEGTLIKAVLWCNEKLGSPIREIKEMAIPVDQYKAKKPLDFEKLIYVCALQATNSIVHEFRNPFDNNFDHDIVYEAKLTREQIGNVDNYMVNIKRETKLVTYHSDNWISLDVDRGSASKFCHSTCPNSRNRGKYTLSIGDENFETPFKSGCIFIIYQGAPKDEEGNILYPFHPLITPFFEWAVKEKIIIDAIMNSDGNYGNLLEIAQREKSKAWLDAFAFTTEREYGQIIDAQRQMEFEFYKQYIKIFE